MKCQYCGEQAKLVKGHEIFCGLYAIRDKWFWECLPCDAHVGCHGDSILALGSLAKADLRKLRREAHKAFDQLWQNGKRDRGTAYTMLSRALTVSKMDCHIGLFNNAQCELVIKYSNELLEKENAS